MGLSYGAGPVGGLAGMGERGAEVRMWCWVQALTQRAPSVPVVGKPALAWHWAGAPGEQVRTAPELAHRPALVVEIQKCALV